MITCLMFIQQRRKRRRWHSCKVCTLEVILVIDCPWIDDELKGLMTQIDSKYKCYVKTKNVGHWEEYRQLRNRLKRLQRDARNLHFSLLLEEQKSAKDLWKILNSQGAG
ncbi:hypothetical protein J6590_092560 [Homalodisca vitripennis]|nr:hypothetical protein J6590_083236 [Homalodisca vitripennis]KAG8299390.1 hypothetical protein J6590_102213 [Homalodisca vitripennis]KAG8309166.1 hypothetical protein J6590_092560 [Homalodisca vitripennis]